ncbi:ThiF family protein [Marvinbryantia formatexigens DSM 14469]|uniref:ThiF family protein n=1 Tax=Marvinbryantia formatexigens DSM 14469 TaxID=478749 RepID=C6LHD9_9FIRM|nr:tRNA threonylcarbamoyladenosine dehydratase [Marvinbryantia formatexigens]EET59926.1 ThiF family protein [Marvinbryantia formatexigens DSM 14469]UWO26945.1 tRNA threonylcarbamoyladenosine dehydratase [Marvinbryantia formatexigens DSM 14469]SDF42467.1 tRNA A37 threonylcarbamoyladenosine dehydratase [Marvinbryantia formatexigens]
MTEENQFSRTELLIGKDNLDRLSRARVAVFGVGGVGGYVVEALARSGVGTLDLIDSDKVASSNLNRQIIATYNTIGQYKVDAARERVLSINPQAVVNAYRTFYLPETAAQFDFASYDYVVDAIDTVTGKLMLAEQAQKSGTPIISSMGAGNKMDASAFEVADIYETSVCPLAKVMRRELKKRGIRKLKVVYSKETPLTPRTEDRICGQAAEKACGQDGEQTEQVCTAGNAANGSAGNVQEAAVGRRRQTPGSMAFVPAVAGLIIAGEVVRDLIGM